MVGDMRPLTGEELRDYRRTEQQRSMADSDPARPIDVRDAVAGTCDRSKIFDANNKTVVFVPFFNPSAGIDEKDRVSRSSYSSEEGARLSIDSKSGGDDDGHDDDEPFEQGDDPAGHRYGKKKTIKRKDMRDAGEGTGQDPGRKSRGTGTGMPGDKRNRWADVRKGLKGRSKKAVIEMTTTKPIEIRMVPIDKKAATFEAITSEHQAGESITRWNAGGMQAKSLEDLCQPSGGDGRPRWTEEDMNRPSSQTMERIAKIETASQARQSCVSHTIRRLTVAGGLRPKGMPMTTGGDYGRDSRREYSPAKQASMKAISAAIHYDRVDVVAVDFRLDVGFSHVTADTQGSTVALSGRQLTVVGRSSVENEDRSAMTRCMLESDGVVVKLFSDGRLVLHDKFANCLYLFDTDSRQIIKSIKGKTFKRNLHETRVILGYSHDQSKYLWRRSETVLAVVDLRDFEVSKEINGFWPAVPGDLLFDSFAICDDSTATVVCVNKTSAGTGNVVCHYFGGGKISHVGLTAIIKNGTIRSSSCLLLGPHLRQRPASRHRSAPRRHQNLRLCSQN